MSSIYVNKIEGGREMKSRIRLQPLVNLDNRSIFGYEALYRRPSVQDKYPSAVQILKKISENGGCPQDFNLFINMSMQDIVNKKFCERLVKVLEDNRIDGRHVVFEVNEDTPPDTFEKAIPMLNSLRKYNVQVALDDFGLNYSIVNFAKNFKFDFVKIDQSLVQQAVVSEHAMNTMMCLVNAANNAGCTIVAEGIETEKQLACVIDAGIKIGQGFLFVARKSSFIQLDDFSSFLIENGIAA